MILLLLLLLLIIVIYNDIYISKTKCHLIICQYENLGKSIAAGKPLPYS